MRDRNFITWLVGLIATPIALTAFPNYAASLASTLPLVLCGAALLSLLVMIATRSERPRRRLHPVHLMTNGRVFRDR